MQGFNCLLDGRYMLLVLGVSAVEWRSLSVALPGPQWYSKILKCGESAAQAVHTSAGTVKLPSCLRLVGGTPSASQWCTKVEQLEGVHCGDLQVMPFGTSKLSCCLGSLSRSLPGSQLGVEVLWLDEVHRAGLQLMPLSVGGSSATWGHWVRVRCQGCTAGWGSLCRPSAWCLEFSFSEGFI